VGPLEVLSLPPDATPSEVKARWRELAALHHPDRGGDPALFDRYRQAYVKAYEAAKRCRACGGTGKQLVNKGLSQLVVRCPVCKGVKHE